MKQTVAFAAAVTLTLGTGLRAAEPVIRGDYVEVRTAEVFTGGCILGSEGETSGREAIMAWRVASGAFKGVALDGLAVVAVVAADRNLGTHELGGASPGVVKSVLLTDERATSAQRQALVDMTRALAPSLVNDIVEFASVPIAFSREHAGVRVSAGAASLDVATHVKHSPECGAIQWFEPLAKTDSNEIGLTRSQSWSGTALGTQWKQLDRKSSFVGTFKY
jgi:hypothetical protein